MRWDGVVVTPYLGPVGLALYVLFCKEPGQRVLACPSGHEECAQADRPKECPSEIRVESTSLGSRRLQLINDQPSDSNRREDGGDREDAVVEHVTPLTPASSPSVVRRPEPASVIELGTTREPIS